VAHTIPETIKPEEQMATLNEAVQEALQATAGQPAEVQAAAVRAAIPPPSGHDASWLWKALVLGLLVILVIATIGVISVVADGDKDTNADVLVTIFTSVLTGLIGLFVKSPTQS
jgi:hypothetical protein